MAKLDGLIRLHRYQLDEKQKQLGDLNALLTQQEDELKALEAERMRELDVAKADAFLAASLPAYLKSYEFRKDKKKKAIKKLEDQIAKVRDEMGLIFADLKKYEIVDRRRKDEEEKQRLKDEAQELDAIALDRFARDQRES